MSECLHPALCLGGRVCPERVDPVGQTDLEAAEGLGGTADVVRGLQLHDFLQVYLRQLLPLLGGRGGKERDKDKRQLLRN